MTNAEILKKAKPYPWHKAILNELRGGWGFIKKNWGSRHLLLPFLGVGWSISPKFEMRYIRIGCAKNFRVFNLR